MLSSILPPLLISSTAFVSYLFYYFLFRLPSIDAPSDRRHLDGKVVWITGASSGIGAALARYLMNNTTTKVVLSARNMSELERVKSDLVASGVNDVFILPIDLIAMASDYTLAQSAVAAVIERFGRVDIIINNGGMSMRGSCVDTSMSVDTQVMNCNYFGTIALTKALLPSMIQRRSGHIAVMSSVQGKLPISMRSSYAASKHAVHGWFQSMRYEAAEYGIGLSLICPGYVKTNISINALAADGTSYAKMDPTTAKGYAPSYIAELTYAAYRRNIDEVVVADAFTRIAIMLYVLVPTLFTKMMLKRRRSEVAKLAREENEKKGE